MTTGGQMSLVEKLEAYAKEGHFGLKTKAWERDLQKLEREGIKVNIVAHFRPGEVSCFIDWSECAVDLANYSADTVLTQGNRLWLMAYQAQHPEVQINI